MFWEYIVCEPMATLQYIVLVSFVQNFAFVLGLRFTTVHALIAARLSICEFDDMLDVNGRARAPAI